MMEVPGFEIKKTIGKGGMGTAYLAVQESLGRQVVLKTMNTGQADQTDFLERFLNEGRIVAALRHPNIITIFDIGATDELVYMSMEYVEGGDLKSKIAKGCTPDEALSVMERIASALEFAHREGVIHRDVKPANILFRNDGTPLLSDFGIAKQTRIDTELTSTGTILGSPFYMSPEQAEGHKVDGRADIYSLGIIFYEMLTGDRPYPGESAIKIIVQHIQSPIPDLPGSLGKFQPLLNQMIAKNREDRIPDAGAVVERVRELRRATVQQRPAPKVAVESPEQPASSPRAEGFVEHNKRALALGAMLLMLTLSYGGFYLYTQSLTRSTFARPSTAPVTVDGSTEGTAVVSSGSGVPAVTASTAPPSGGPDREEIIRALEWLAEARLKQDQLTEPPADNAHYYFSRLFPLDKEKAGRGFALIAERFVVLAEKQFSDRNYRQAQAYITLGLQVQPDNEGLLALQSFIDNREKSVLENLIDFFADKG